jgi:anti-sigma factor ChrR (cupin superfamily)
MYQNITTADASKAIPLPIPGSTPTITMQPLNLDYSIGPATLLFHFGPGTFIPAHYHKKANETFYVIDGEFIDDGQIYPAGTFFACTPGTVHGPHETKTGATVLVIQTAQVDGSDFYLAGE